MYKAILLYCFKCRKNTESKKEKVAKAKKRRRKILSKRAFFNSKRSRFFEEQEASGLLCSLRTMTPVKNL